jgi:hypothetical protein
VASYWKSIQQELRFVYETQKKLIQIYEINSEHIKR